MQVVYFSVTTNIKQEPGTSGYYTNAYERLYLSQGDTIQLVDSRTDQLFGSTGSVSNRYIAVGINDSGQIVYSVDNINSSPRVYTIRQIFLNERIIDTGVQPLTERPSQVSFRLLTTKALYFIINQGMMIIMVVIPTTSSGSAVKILRQLLCRIKCKVWDL